MSNDKDDDLGQPVPQPPVIPAPAAEYPIDLSTALRLAEVENPTIAISRTAVMEALALQMAARSLLLPSFNAGLNYHGHTGNLQRSSGRILSLSEQSLYFGGGAKTLAAESLAFPAVGIFSSLTDAWYEPLAARQRVSVSRYNVQATSNDILLDVVLLHLDLLGNQSILEAQRLTESQVFEVVRITRQYAIAGEGRKADADRSAAEWKLRRTEVQQAEESVGVAAARLANRLNLDPAVRLRPVGGPLVPINLIALDTQPQELIRVALQRRPDLNARSAAVAEAEVKHKQELARPWIPTLWLGFSGGAFGGGSNIVPPFLGNFGGRTDFDVRLYWTVMNLGAGNLSLQNRRRAEVGAALAERARTINRVRDEVTASLAESRAALAEIEMARRELASAEKGFQEDLARSRQNIGRPIEVLNSLNLLGDARVNLIHALVKFDKAQFRLFVALGSPPPLVNPPQENPGPPPVNTPLMAPFAVNGHKLKASIH